MDPADYKWYLDLRRYGTVPHSRLSGLGFETDAHVCDGAWQNISRRLFPLPARQGVPNSDIDFGPNHWSRDRHIPCLAKLESSRHKRPTATGWQPLLPSRGNPLATF